VNAVYVQGRGLASALGIDLRGAVDALRHGGVTPTRFEVAEGFGWPFYRIAEAGDAPDWTARARRLVLRVAAEAGALAGPRRGALFVASSSQDQGAREGDASQPADYLSFADNVAAWLDWQGPVFTVATACTSGLNALLSARAWLVSHRSARSAPPFADHALVLGIELLNRFTVGGFGAMQLLSHTRALPLGAARAGLVLGEAVAALSLSSQPLRWRLAGGANVVDGRDPAGAVPAAVIEMCRRVLSDAGLAPRDIALIKPQAAGSPANDATEIRALQQVFAPLPALMPLKAAIGHTLGASGVAELALLMACLEAGVWPRADWALDPALLVQLPDQAPLHARHVLASILGFGGGHAAVVLEDGAA
jgi:3-oxoacyl-[acyl-carrier-protein] synthase I